MSPTKRFRLFRTIGFRLAALYTGLFSLSVLTLFGIVYWITSEALHQQLANAVEQEIATLVEDHRARGLSGLADSIERRIASNSHPSTYYLLLNPEGQKAAGNLPALAPREGWRALPRPGGEEDDTGDEPDDRDARRLSALGVALPDNAFLLVGADAYRIVEVQEAIARAFGWAFGLTILLGGAVGFGVSRGFLRRIDAIGRTSRAIIEGKLSDRVPTRGSGDELDRLALNVNEMLDRVQTLVESLRQVSNDIAHDLRTPLSRLRQRLEGARLKAGSVEDYEAAIDRAIADADATLGVFAALLRIAQIEARIRRDGFSTIDLSAVFKSVADTYEAVTEDGGRRLVFSIEPDLKCRGDRELLTQMLVNLVENAIRHTPEGAAITLTLTKGPEGPVGIVADDGPGIPVDERKKVFQRFYRLERSRSTAGSGLGLSLVAAVADIHGISVRLEDNQPGVRIVLGFPSRAWQRVQRPSSL